MPLWKSTQHSFAAGQLDANVMGRQDMDIYFRGATLLKNFLVKRQGCISKRRGTDLAADLDGLLGTAYDGTPITPEKIRLVPVTNGDDGRYLVLSGGIGFVASRRGVLMCDGGSMRSIPAYVAQDADGNAANVVGKDYRHSVSTPVDVIHVAAGGSETVTRYASLQAALTAAVDGDTVRLHDDIAIDSTVDIPDFETASTITLDLYGYRMTVIDSSAIVVGSEHVSLRVRSARPGAKVIVCAMAQDAAAFAVAYGSIALDDHIEYVVRSGDGVGAVVTASDSAVVYVNSGIFDLADADARAISGRNFGAIITGGRFTYPSGGAAFDTDTSLTISIRRGEFSSTTVVSTIYSSSELRDLLVPPAPGMNRSVLNDEYPNAAGLYGAKVDGEADYTADAPPVPYRFAVPYKDEELADLCIRQSGDTLFIAHRDHPPAKIVFDRDGFASWEEISFDNADYSPPVIESAVMEGQDPVETAWPAGFDNSLKNKARALGVVVDAGMNSNSSSGDDGSSQTATTYQCTVEQRDRVNGKKTITTLVKTDTTSRAVQKTIVHANNQYINVNNTIDTTGTAQNQASATSVLVTRTARYVATYIKNGKESRPSAAVSVDYDMPWANNAVVRLSLSRGANDEEPDCYNVYKDNGNGFGLIATTGVESVASGVAGDSNSESLLSPDNSAPSASILSAAAFEERRRWNAGETGRRLVPEGRDAFSARPANDICLVSPPSNATAGIELSFGSGGARFRRIGLVLDGRIYDGQTDKSYVVISTDSVVCTITYAKADGTTATATKTLAANSAQPCPGRSAAGGMLGGMYVDWLPLEEREFATPDGGNVKAWLCGKGDCTEFFNTHLRRVVFDLSDFTYASGQNVDKVRSVVSAKFTFGASAYPHGPSVSQGCVHAIRFYGAAAATAGNVQDDYINPDMSITPPTTTMDRHFAAADEYPGCVGVHEQRLVFASSRSNPSTVWMSRVADLYNFTARESIREDDALELTLAATEFPDVNHLVTGRDLLLFGDGGEWIVAPVQGNALTYKTASAKMQSMIGSSRTLRPLQLADETLFAERDGSCLRTINYNYASDSYQSRDLSVVAQSIFRSNPIVSMAYKQHPDSIVECVLADGRVATLVYMREQEVAAWSVQELGGGWMAREIASPRCIVRGTTEMMLLVERNGAFQLWKVRDDDDDPAAASQVTLDALHVEDSGEPGTGEVAVSLGNGTYAVGYPIESEFVSVRPEPEKGQTAQMEIKNSTETELRVTDATTFSVKPYGVSSGWREVPLPVVRDGAAVALKSMDCKRLMTGVNNRDGRIHLLHSEPWPLTILSISTTYQVEYENGRGGDGE